ncbi:MAG: hypothetical protein MI700_07255 [Balneolales bacterium]|nr:hypothetical protein [Balneolales bacterium]
MKYFLPYAFLLLAILSPNLYSQSGALRLNFDEEGTTYVRASIRAQLWARYTDLNPGSEIYGEAADTYFDVSARRLRLNINAQVTPKIYMSALFGGNNMNYTTSDTFVLKVLDLYAEYKFSDFIELGMGKSGWQGLTRNNVRSSASLMALDAPLFSLNTVNRTDDTARNLGLWIKGKVKDVDYRFVLNNTLAYNGGAPAADAEFATIMPRLKSSGYVKYEFFDKESNKSGYSSSTHLGSKKVFNIGLGFMHQPRATWSSPNGTDTLFHDLTHFAVDVFFDSPVNSSAGTAITSFLGWYQMDYGPDYIRNVGANNAANGTNGNRSFNGTGNAFPMMGTGTTIFFQLGYLMRKDLLGEGNEQIQPNIAIQFSQFEKLDDPVLVYDLGVNLFIKGHLNKLTLGLQNRPVFFDNGTDIAVEERKNMMVLQYQITIN